MDYRKRLYERYASRMQDRGETFDEAAAKRWARSYRRYVRGLLPADKAAPIADVGCGCGMFLYLLRQSGYTDLHGVDISSEQVALARQVCDDVREGDAIEYLEARPGEFAFISALDLIEHFRKDEVLRFLDACHEALVPGGRLVLQTPNAESPWGLMHRYHDFTHEVCFDPNCLLRLLNVCGFSGVRARELGPVVHGLKSGVRWMLWKVIRRTLWVWNIVETGYAGSGVYTRVFLASGAKR